MLYSTFRHLKGIGTEKERQIWRSGIFSWDDFELRQIIQLPLLVNSNIEDEDALFYSSRQALEREDAEFFAARLPREEYYRIALNFPSKTLFLDIETTGLSRYYDTITIVGWGIGTKYNVYIKGQDTTHLRKVLSEAKVIVTFNGSLFDIPFLRQEFPDLQIPSIHIDLRFFAKRVGLSGGQKKIEKLIGLNRPIHLNNLEGETAPLLWHKYCKGDLESLKLLIDYNNADIEGMKQIFDVAVEGFMQKQKIPLSICKVHQFAKNKSKLQWSSEKNQKINNKIQISPYQGKKGSIISFNDLASCKNLSAFKVVGIDLSGSEVRTSGWCLLEGNYARTQPLKTDADIITATLDAKPDLVAIDSPLSLPKGRLTVDDNDPGRKIYGITRVCERVLKQRGINVYPSLIQSMQGLTARGIRLASYFRNKGIPVIESYPGAAQDIMRIPRKQAGLEFLRDGLAEFGIEGEFRDRSVSHDELDAITSAIVGLFFWSDMFEALGNEEEEYLIIPDIKIDPNSREHLRVIGFSGSIAAGKTTAGMYLKSYGFHYNRFSSVLADILRERGVDPSREALQQIGIEVNSNPGQRWLCKQLIQKLPNNGNLVIDGLRFPEDRAFFVERFGSSFLHIHIDLPEVIRLERYIARGGNHEEFINASSRPTEANIPILRSLAHMVVTTTEELESVLFNITETVNYTQQAKKELNACL